MKRNLSGSIAAALILTGIMNSSGIAAFAQNENNVTGIVREFSEPSENGYISSKRVNIATGEPEENKHTAKNKYGLKNAGNLPERVDLRESGLTTSIKNQGSEGLCWAFACCSAIENNIMKKGIDVLPSVYKKLNEPDLSESHLGYYPFVATEEYPDRLDGEKKGASGGNSYYAMSALASGIGPVGENVFPYDLTVNNITDDFKSIAAVALDSADIIYENSEQSREILKSWLADGYSASVSYYAGSSMPGVKVNPQTGEKVSAVYQSSSSIPNHQVNVIGYDDNFPKELFSGGTPQGDGAFLIKNSWGETYGTNGYIWISYYDASLCEFARFDMKTADYDNIYQYDSAFTNTAFTFEKTANVFTAKGNEILKSVGIENPNDRETSATAEIYKLNENYKNPTDGTKVATVKSSFISEGFKTIDLESPIEFNEGEAFSVVVSLKCGNENGMQFVEMNSDANLAVYTYNAGESYVYTIKNNKVGWYDSTDINLNEYGFNYGTEKIGNNCIKAYTVNKNTRDKTELEQLFAEKSSYNFNNANSFIKTLYTYACKDAEAILEDESASQYKIDGVCKQLEFVYEKAEPKKVYNIASAEDWINIEKMLDETKWQNSIEEINITTDIQFNDLSVFEYDSNGLVCGYKDGDNVVKINGFKQFKGTLNGGGHTLSGIVLDGNKEKAGLINTYCGGTISDVTVKNSCFINSRTVGGLIGKIQATSMEECSVKNIKFDNCMVRSYGTQAGGIIGIIEGNQVASINSCNFIGNVCAKGESLNDNERIKGLSDICYDITYGYENLLNKSQNVSHIYIDSNDSAKETYICASYLENTAKVNFSVKDVYLEVESLKLNLPAEEHKDGKGCTAVLNRKDITDNIKINPEYYNLNTFFINDVNISEINSSNIYMDGNALVLDNAVIDAVNNDRKSIAAIYTNVDNAEIKVIGENTINTTISALYSEKSFKITGNGTLNINVTSDIIENLSKDVSFVHAVYSNDSIEIDGVKININISAGKGQGAEMYGIHAGSLDCRNSDIFVKLSDESNIPVDFKGIYCTFGSVNMDKCNYSFDAVKNYSRFEGCGIYTGGSSGVNIKNSDISVKFSGEKEIPVDLKGINTIYGNAINIDGCSYSFNADKNYEGFKSFGIYGGDNDINIKNSSVNIKASEYGISSVMGLINLEGVTADIAAQNNCALISGIFKIADIKEKTPEIKLTSCEILQGGTIKNYSNGSNCKVSVVANPNDFFVDDSDYEIKINGSKKVVIGKASERLKGDIDNDGNVNSSDALEVLKIIVGITVPNEQTQKLADMDGNGKIETLDALSILKIVVGLV